MPSTATDASHLPQHSQVVRRPSIVPISSEPTTNTLPLPITHTTSAPVTPKAQNWAYLKSQAKGRLGFQFLNALVGFSTQLFTLHVVTKNLTALGSVNSLSTSVMKAVVANAIESLGPKLKFNEKTEFMLRIADGFLDAGGFVLGSYLVANGRDLRKQYAQQVEGVTDPNAMFGDVLKEYTSTVLALTLTAAVGDYVHYMLTAGVQAMTNSVTTDTANHYECKPLDQRKDKAWKYLKTVIGKGG
jgi:hypothetical protein